MKAAYEGYSFKLNENVTRTKVEFHNRYGIRLADDLYLPKDAGGSSAAVFWAALSGLAQTKKTELP